MHSPTAHVRIDFADGSSLGPGKIALLDAIGRTGSLSGAGRALGMSYRRAWLLLHSVNDAFAEAAVEFSVGGKDGGGARLTDFGRTLVANYAEVQRASDALVQKALGALLPGRGPPPPAATAARRPVTRALPGRRGRAEATRD